MTNDKLFFCGFELNSNKLNKKVGSMEYFICKLFIADKILTIRKKWNSLSDLILLVAAVSFHNLI